MPGTIGAMSWSVGRELALAVYIFALVFAAVSDFHHLRIPNWLTGALAAGFPAVALAFGRNVQWLSHLEAGAAVFVVAAALFAFRVMGGGDVKLLAATALWLGLGQLLPFLFLTAIVGGAFAVMVLLLRQPIVQTGFLQLLRRLPSFAQKDMPIPYGIPIAIAGILMAPSLAFLT